METSREHEERFEVASPRKWHPRSPPKRSQLSRDRVSRWCWFTRLATKPGWWRQQEREPGLWPRGCLVPPRPWPSTTCPSGPWAAIRVDMAKLVLQAVVALPSEWDTLAGNWELAGSEHTHMSDGGEEVGDPLSSLAAFTTSLDAPHRALPGWLGQCSLVTLTLLIPADAWREYSHRQHCCSI